MIIRNPSLVGPLDRTGRWKRLIIMAPLHWQTSVLTAPRHRPTEPPGAPARVSDSSLSQRISGRSSPSTDVSTLCRRTSRKSLSESGTAWPTPSSSTRVNFETGTSAVLPPCCFFSALKRSLFRDNDFDLQTMLHGAKQQRNALDHRSSLPFRCRGT